MNSFHLTYKYLVCLSAGFLLLSANPDTASGRQLVYEHIDVNMVLNRDTSLDVVETQRVQLNGDWNGLYRYYSLYGCDGIEITGVSENDTVYKEGTISLKGGYIVQHEKGRINVKWRSRNVKDPPYNNTETTFQIRYRIRGAIGQYWRRDVLYWKPLMRDCEYRIKAASVTLNLPEEVEPERVEVVFYTRAPEAKWQINQQDRRSVHFSAMEIGRKDKFEIKVSLPKGMVEQYSSLTYTYAFHIKPWVFPVGAVATVLVLLIIWSKIGRDPVPEPQQVYDIDVLDIMPGLAGLLIDESFDVQDITATIMDLARRGYIHIDEIKEEQEHKSRWFQEPSRYEFELVKVPEKGELTGYEELLIKRLFQGRLVEGEKISTDKLNNRFYKHIPKIKKKAWQQVQTLGWFAKLPKKAKKPFIIIGLIIIASSLALAAFENREVLFFAVWGSMFAGIPGMVLLSNVKRSGLKGLLKSLFLIPFVVIGLGVLFTVSLKNYRTSGWMVDSGITGVFIGSLICISGGAMARKSKQGAAVKQRLNEMRNTLKRSEAMGLSFEDLLPWAIAFGVTKDYLENIAGVPDIDIPYYRPYSRHYSSGLSGAETVSSVLGGLSAMTSTIGSSLSSSPSGGGSGGGGSGGGGGGGGGGGW